MERLIDSERINYAVSGSHGFIGGAVSERLTNDGHNVKKIGRQGIRMHNAQVFVDCAGYGNLYGQTNVSEIYKANVERAIDLVLRNEEEHYRAFILLSTSSVKLPVQTYYSASKHAMEEFVKVYARDTQKPVVAIRPYSITGVGEQKEHLIPKLIDSCLNQTPMSFVTEPVHDFLDIDDFVDGVLTVAAHASENPGAIYSIGSGHQHTNLEVRELVEEVTGKRANITVVSEPMRKYDTEKNWIADNTAICALGWEPKKTLIQSIEEMVNAY